MNVLTSSWDDSDYATATKFQCRKSGQILTIAANNPDKVRSMHDACLSGSYAADPSIINGGANVAGGAGPTATISGTASWNAAAAPVWGGSRSRVGHAWSRHCAGDSDCRAGRHFQYHRDPSGGWHNHRHHHRSGKHRKRHG